MKKLILLLVLFTACKKKCECYNRHERWNNDHWEYVEKTKAWKSKCDKQYYYVYDGATRYITICSEK